MYCLRNVGGKGFIFGEKFTKCKKADTLPVDGIGMQYRPGPESNK